MIRLTRHIASRLLLLLYLAGFAAMELGHAHHHVLLGGGIAVSSHDCGANERHIPPEKISTCPACAVGHLKTSLVPEGSWIPPLLESKESLPGDLPRRPIYTVSPSCGERAPPRTTS